MLLGSEWELGSVIESLRWRVRSLERSAELCVWSGSGSWV